MQLLERSKRRGVTLVSVAESLDTGSAAGRLVLNIMTAVSQWEREAIGERTRDAMSQAYEKGERVGNIQLGHRLCADWKHVEPDGGEQALLEEIQRLRQGGATLRRIAAALNHRGHRQQASVLNIFLCYCNRLVRERVHDASDMGRCLFA